MKKGIQWTLALLLAMLMTVPSVSLADIGNSGKITKDLPETVEDLTINASNVDIKLKVVAEGKPPYAEMDATVFGIHSDDVTYNLDITETDDGVTIDIKHSGKDFGINNVDVDIYMPGPLKNLTLMLENCDIAMNDIYSQIATGHLSDSEIDGKGMEVYSLTMTLVHSDLELRGIIGGVDLTADKSEIDIRTSIVPEGLEINGSDSEVELAIPKGFSLKYDVKTGYFYTNTVKEYHEREGTIQLGEGGPQFTVDLNGGRVNVKEQK